MHIVPASLVQRQFGTAQNKIINWMAVGGRVALSDFCSTHGKPLSFWLMIVVIKLYPTVVF